MKFLQGILTNDVLKSAAGEGVYSLMLNRKGRVLADMRLFRDDSETFLDVETDAEETTANLMEGLKLSYAVEIKSGGGRALFHLAGPEAPVAVSGVLERDVREMKRFEHFRSAVSGARIWAARTDRVGGAGFDIETRPEDAGKIAGLFERSGVFPADGETFEILRIESGTPRYGRDMDESVIAPETGIEDAVSFEKGCYVGQEIVARAHWRGRVNRLLSGFLFKGDDAPARGSAVVAPEDGGPAGSVTSSAVSPDLGAVAMGYIRREFSEFGTAVKTEDGHEGRVCGFPLGRPDSQSAL